MTVEEQSYAWILGKRTTSAATPDPEATTLWTGNTDADHDVAGNWSNVVPTNSDTVIFTTSANDMTDNVSGDVQAEHLRIAKIFTGTLGATGTPYLVRAREVIIEKTVGELWLKLTAERVIVMNAPSGNGLTISTAATSFIRRLVIHRAAGTIKILGTSVVDAIDLIPQEGRTAALSIASGATIGAVVVGAGGTLTTASSLASLTMNGGSVTVTGAAGITTANIGPGAMLLHQGSSKVTATIYGGGTMSLSGNPNSSISIDGTTVYRGGLLNVRNGYQNAAATVGVNMRGGELRVDAGQTVTVA